MQQQQQQQQLNEGYARVAAVSELVEDAMYMATTAPAVVPPESESSRGISQSTDKRT
jgi:type II secretory pathway component PulM